MELYCLHTQKMDFATSDIDSETLNPLHITGRGHFKPKVQP